MVKSLNSLKHTLHKGRKNEILFHCRPESNGKIREVSVVDCSRGKNYYYRRQHYPRNRRRMSALEQEESVMAEAAADKIPIPELEEKRQRNGPIRVAVYIRVATQEQLSD